MNVITKVVLKYRNLFLFLNLIFVLALSGCGKESGGEQAVCTISIDSSAILANMDQLEESKTEFVPEDGWVLKPVEITFTTGDTVFDILKVIFISLASFFGAAFSIMTFNTDVDVGTLFKQIYQQVTGNISSGFTILEISYSIGLAAGVLFFFNHFGKKKFSADPTPMQVQMRQYEDDVNTTLLEESSRKKASS